jgi:hypothetical protein
MASNRLTVFGLLLVLFGWILLLFGGELSLLASNAMGRPLPVGLDLGRTDVAQSLILSGFALAILGALRAGVATLRQFFEAVLQRAAAAKAQPAPPNPAPLDPEAVVERGWIRDRPFVRYADGSVEVETLLGVRRFTSFSDAEGFVGS